MTKEMIFFPCYYILLLFSIGFIPSVYSETQVLIAAKRCPFPLAYRSTPVQNSGPNSLKLIVGFDDSSRPLTSCRVLNGTTYIVGRSYFSFTTIINNTWVDFGSSCHIRDANGNEVLVRGGINNGPEIQTLYTSADNLIVWVEKNKVVDWPKVTPVPAQTLSSKTKVKNVTPGKLFVARCQIDLDDGTSLKLPGVVYETDLNTAYVTYDETVYTCTNYEVPICV